MRAEQLPGSSDTVLTIAQTFVMVVIVIQGTLHVDEYHTERKKNGVSGRICENVFLF